jgi:capsular polysaccharide biosynthesis protein
MNTSQKPNEFEDVIDLKEIFSVLVRRWPLFLACCLIGAVLLFLVSAFFLPKIYSSSVELYVNNLEYKQSGDVTSSDIDASRRLSNTYIVVLKNAAVQDQVVEELGGAIDADEIGKVVQMEAIEDTEVVRISARTEDPALSKLICNTYAKVAPAVLERVVQAGSVEIIGEATTPDAPVSPNVPRNTAIGALAGLLISIIGVYLARVFDNTIKSGYDLRERLDVAVLGEIPEFKNPGEDSAGLFGKTREGKNGQA